MKLQVINFTPRDISHTLSCRHTFSKHCKRARSHRSRSRVLYGVRNEQKTGEEEIYVGDGKVIIDDPKKYPSREDAGLMQGATGGWAGGEPGLQKFMEDIQPEEGNNSKTTGTVKNSKLKKTGKGEDKIYVGFDYRNPEDLEARNRGEQGNFVLDDVNKYPVMSTVVRVDGLKLCVVQDRDYIGWIPLQGGFAGGEVGLQKFLEDGDLEILPSDIKGKSQMSPVVIGIFIAAVATTGGLLLTGAIDFGEGLLALKVDQSPLDDKTKLLLEAAVGLLFLTWLGGVVLAVVRTVKERLDASAAAAQKLAVSLTFWIIVLYATYNLAKI